MYNETLKVIEPYDSDTMIYDKNTHRYILTLTSIEKANGRYSNDGVATQRLLEMSNNVYLYIYSNASQSNRYYIEFIISCTKQGRDFIEQVLTEQLYADLESRQNDICKQTAIDFQSGRIIDRQVIKANRICVNAEDTINSGICGINLMFQGTYNAYFKLGDLRYETYKY